MASLQKKIKNHPFNVHVKLSEDEHLNDSVVFEDETLYPRIMSDRFMINLKNYFSRDYILLTKFVINWLGIETRK